MKTVNFFTVEKTEKNWNWCYKNLMPEDYEIAGSEICIYYQYSFQKEDILNAIKKEK